MIRLNIHEAKTHLSGHLARLAKGESILLCKRNRPIAEVRPLPKPRAAPRPLGLAKGKVKIPSTFFRPLPASVLKAFGGGKP